ncbi:MAG: CPBP family intramembrane glutamic endopeptidase, partial [Acidobacteriota bacterium]
WAMGALTIALAVAMAASAGAMHFSAHQITVAESARNFLILFVVFLIAAAFEEVLFRGFAFQTLIRDVGPVAAVIITSAAFAALHLGNEGASVLPIINTALAGVWLGVAYIRTRSLWLATALHHSWNLVMVFVFGLPVSGIAGYKHMALLDGEGYSPVWISGGEYGPEGGVAATLAVALCAVAIARSRLFKASDEMRAAIIPGSAETPTGLFPKDSSR